MILCLCLFVFVYSLVRGAGRVHGGFTCAVDARFESVSDGSSDVRLFLSFLTPPTLPICNGQLCFAVSSCVCALRRPGR